jgi:hypothetical protein
MYFFCISCVLVSLFSCATQENKTTAAAKNNPLVGIWIQNSPSPLAWNFCFNDNRTFYAFFRTNRSSHQTNPKFTVAEGVGEVPEEIMEAIGNIMTDVADVNPIIMSGSYISFSENITIYTPTMVKGVWQKDESSANWKYEILSNDRLYLFTPDGQRIYLRKESIKLNFDINKIISEEELIGITLAQAEELFSRKFTKIDERLYKIPFYYPNFAEEVRVQINENNIITVCMYFLPGSQKKITLIQNELTRIYGNPVFQDNRGYYRENLPNNLKEIFFGLTQNNGIAIVYNGHNDR